MSRRRNRNTTGWRFLFVVTVAVAIVATEQFPSFAFVSQRILGGRQGQPQRRSSASSSSVLVTTCTMLAATEDSDNRSFGDDDDDDDDGAFTATCTETQQQQQELWLDLRDIVMHPKAAVDYLEEKLLVQSSVLGFQRPILPDRILLSEQVFQNLVDHSDLYLTCESQIIYQTTTRSCNNNKVDGSKTNDLHPGGIEILSSTGRGLSFPFGWMMPFSRDDAVAVSDPMVAMQILSNGRWLVLGDDNEECDIFSGAKDVTRKRPRASHMSSEDQETMRIDAVGDFLEIASTAFTTGSLVGDTGLILPSIQGGGAAETMADNDNNDNNYHPSGGGLAVPCHYKSSLMRFASTCQSMGGGSASLSEGGILIHNQPKDTSPATLSTALILPFEVDLWEMALLVYGQDQIILE